MNLRSQRVAVLVDVPNLYHACKAVKGAKIHFGKLLDVLRRERELVRAMAFLVEESRRFIHMLKHRYDYSVYTPSKEDGDTDVKMAIHAVSLASKVDAETLVTGDGDFIPVARYLRSQGVRVEIACYDDWKHKGLPAVADRYISLDEKEVLL